MVFQRNTRAISFYERNGFRMVKETDGATCEEKLPDALYEWRRSNLSLSECLTGRLEISRVARYNCWQDFLDGRDMCAEQRFRLAVGSVQDCFEDFAVFCDYEPLPLW